MAIQKVGVVGCGLMGSGIAQSAAQAGFPTVVTEAAQEYLDRGMKRIHGAWDTMVAKGKISADDAKSYNARLQATLYLEDLRDCDIVIEAIMENKEEKVKIFRALDAILKPSALIVSNTSSLPITDLASVTKRAANVAGLHFFNPVPLMKLVEIVRALETSDTTVATLHTFAQGLGKTSIVTKDTAGFVVNFLLIPYLLSAIRMFESGVATKEDIDTAMKLGTSYPMGPFALLDYVGLDTTLYAAEVIYAEHPEPANAPPALLRRMVAAGHLGKKSGKGFYDYNA